jgi:hypothetical protein
VLLPAAYALVLLAAAVLSSWRREMTLVRATTVLWLTAAFLVTEIGLALRGAGLRSPGLVVFPLVLLAVFPFRDRWLVNRYDEAAMGDVLGRSLEQLRIPFERTETGYDLRVKTGVAGILLRPLPRSWAVVRIRDESGSRKIELLRALIRKRLGRLVPRPRIRFG